MGPSTDPNVDVVLPLTILSREFSSRKYESSLTICNNIADQCCSLTIDTVDDGSGQYSWGHARGIATRLVGACLRNGKFGRWSGLGKNTFDNL